MEEVTTTEKPNPNPLVSIIVITYNSAKYVLETLESAKAQTYQNIELIITDDASQDETVEICRNWLAENKGRFVRTELVTVEENTGTSANCNRGLYKAEGEWVKFIAGDDMLINNYLAEVFLFSQSQSVKVIHTDVQYLYDNEIIVKNKPEKRLQKFNLNSTTAQEQFEILLRHNPIIAPSVILHKSIFQEVGGFDEYFRLWEDKPLWIKITLSEKKFFFLDKRLVIYRIHDSSIMNMDRELLFSLNKLEFEKNFLIKFGRYLKVSEYILRLGEYYRRRFFIQLNLNRKNLFTRALNKSTFYIFKYWITVNNRKFK
jgi:alpha-1,3-rhamnosyltransferase